ncbi:MAG: ROK family protein [Calditrichaeota bacterium]|nr:MAG: ROK family protein [Calditrichota bacterium]
MPNRFISTMVKTGSKIVVGLDIGGTKMMAASSTLDGQILHRIKHPTPKSLKRGLETIYSMIEECMGDQECLAIGAATGGPLDWKRGVVSPLHQPEWREVPLKNLMEEKFSCPFQVDVDTNVAALGEHHFGKVNSSYMLYVTFSTGVGGGLLYKGEIFHGPDGVHPEVGHQSVNYRCRYPERVVCECGAPDCWEALVSGNGIRRIYRKPPEELTDEEWEEVGYNIAQGLRNLAAIYTPEVIVLGGGLAIGAGKKLISSVESFFQRTLHIVPRPMIQLSTLGYDTVLYGALAIALKQVHGTSWSG